ncbi:hypothetical protein A9Y76_28305 (plasmid) [Ralstonia insidiosa]|jgi:uncharacterized membrane protein YsdA (DUF1294 family)|uniref:DUF1294 domain-containing protein n=2 Tax=Burkholderiaceae TaxID=119060 RepID=A0A192A7Y2_9RALS|nr:hypothetical protein A9Y76_28305 [Ralstonia insidiosa]
MDSPQQQSFRLLENSSRLMKIVAIASSVVVVLTPIFPSSFRLPFLLINSVAFVMFAVDKILARTRQRRIPEAYLHIITLAGGFVGSQIGRSLARHKTKKWSFDVVFATAWVFWMMAFAVFMGIC